jgi:hypothetical protein
MSGDRHPPEGAANAFYGAYRLSACELPAGDHNKETYCETELHTHEPAVEISTMRRRTGIEESFLLRDYTYTKK